MKQVTNRYNRCYLIHDEDEFWQKRMAQGIYQINNIRKLKELVPNARTIVDIGANIGTNTIEYATWAKDVVSFEPHPELYNQLVENIELNRKNIDNVRWDKDTTMNITANITTHNVALGKHQGSVLMKSFTNNKGKNYITEDGTISIQVKTLDDYNLNDVDIIKIDTEGYELFVLQGGMKTIVKYRPVIQTELHQGLFKRQGVTIQDVAQWFYDIGYYAIDKKGNKQPHTLPTNHSGVDLFWIPK